MMWRSGAKLGEVRTVRAWTAAFMLSTSLAAGIVTTYTSAQAQSASQTGYSIPSGSLTRALALFGQQSGLQVTYPSEMTAGKQSPGFSGAATPQQALSRILAGSGLSYSFAGSGTVAISGANTATGTIEGAIALDTIDVSGGGGISSAAGGDPDLQYRAPASSGNITEEQAQRFRGTSPGDFVKGIPGVMVGDVRNSGAIDVNVRGMQGMDRVPIVVDGALQSNTLWRGYAGVTTRSYIDPDFIGGVTIEKGPTAGPDGVGATGGVARMRTLNADDILLPGRNIGARVRGGLMGNTTEPPGVGTRGGVNATYSGGTYPAGGLPSDLTYTSGLDRPSLFDFESGYGSAAVAARTQNVEFVGAFARRKYGNYYAGKNGGKDGRAVLTPSADGSTVGVTWEGLTHFQAGEEVLNSGQDSTSYLGKMTFKLEDGHRLELGYTRFISRYNEMYPSQVMWFGGPYQAAPSDIQIDTYTARYSWKPLDNDLIDLRTDLWKTDSHIKAMGTSILPYPPEILELLGLDPIINYIANGTDARRWGINVSNTSQFDAPMGRVALQYGVSFTNETMQQFDGNPEDPDPRRAGWRDEASGFVASEWKATDWLKFDAALRYTWSKSHDACSGYALTAAERTSCQADPNVENDGWAPILAATLEPWKGIQFYGRYAEAIRAPNLYESTRGQSFTISNAFKLVPEHARNWEFGFNVLRKDVITSGDMFRFKAAYFDNTIDNYLTRTEGPTGTPFGVVMTNLDVAKFRGFELSGSYDAGFAFGELGYTYYTYMNFCLPEDIAQAHSRPECSPAGVTQGFVQMHIPPKDMLTVTLGARFFDRALTGGTRVSLVGDKPKDRDNTIPSGTVLTQWSSYTLVDLFANYKFSENLEAEFNIDNVGDVYYVDALSVGLMPSPGRTARAAMTLKF